MLTWNPGGIFLFIYPFTILHGTHLGPTLSFSYQGWGMVINPILGLFASFYEFYHGQSPINQHLGEYFCLSKSKNSSSLHTPYNNSSWKLGWPFSQEGNLRRRLFLLPPEARGTPGIRTQDEQSMNVLEDMIQNYANAGGLFFFPTLLVYFLCFLGKGKQSGLP